MCFFFSLSLSFESHSNLSTHHSLVAVLLPFQADLVTGPVEPWTVNQCFSTKTFHATYCLRAEAFSVHVTEYIAGVWTAPFWHFFLTWRAVHLVTLLVFSCLFLTSDPTCVYCMWEVVYIVETELFFLFIVLFFFRIKKLPDISLVMHLKIHIHYADFGLMAPATVSVFEEKKKEGIQPV